MSDHILARGEKSKCNGMEVTGTDLESPRENKHALDVKAHETDDRLDAILGALNASADATPEYSTSDALALAVDHEVLSYTIPGTLSKVEMVSASVSGDNRGRFVVKVDGLDIQAKRTWWTTAFNEDFDLNNQQLYPGQVVTIHVDNHGDSIAKFEATLNLNKFI